MISINGRFALFAIVIIGVACGDDFNAPERPVVTIHIPDAGIGRCDDGGCADDVDGGGMGICGDAVVQAGWETCDDGNTIPGDGCSASCQTEICGNGVVEAGEQCEPPGTATCTATCQGALTSCGNATIEAGEECDDGNTGKGDGCRDCRKECGDGVLDREIGEECEPQYTPKDPNGVSTTCTETCRLKPFCGDGKVNQVSEQCEPVNGISCVDDCKRADAVVADAGTRCVPMATDGGVAVPAENLVPNGAFAQDLDGWSAGARVTATRSDEGYTAAGSARVTYAAAAGAPLSVDGIQRCVTITGGQFYEFVARYRNPAGQPAGARAFAVLVLYPNGDCSGSAVAIKPGAAAPTAETGKWLPFALAFDAGVVATASLSIKLGVVVPGDQSGTALWDNVGLRPIDPGDIAPDCGNCKVDKGETCDDGNHIRGDGCSPRCRLERDCGNGERESSEECDDGAVAFSGSGPCTPVCTNKTACDQCAITSCPTQVHASLDLEGVATAGAGRGQRRSALAAQLRACVQRSGCNGDTAISARDTLSGDRGVFLENCYCGTAGTACIMPGVANGSCRAEVEAALETTNPTEILQRVGGANPAYPIFAALDELLVCEQKSCADKCVTPLACGNGIVQERSSAFANTFQLTVGGKKQPCTDGLTTSGRGCSFEECDGGLMCDESCFLIKCGNGVRQAGEECDDGNTSAGDGCDAACKAEFQCGDGMVEAPFEQCDPPGTGKVCSLAEFEANPSSCGCGTTCEYKVCGNGIVQDGEQCDPPNGSTCGPDCKNAGLGECVECLLLMTEGECGATTYLKGDPDLDFTGCLDEPSCFALLKCQIDSRCATSLAPANCFCGLDEADVQACESPDFQPKGPCKAEFLAAYSSQFGMTPANNKAVLDDWFRLETAPGRPAALFAGNSLVSCLGEASGQLEKDLAASGVSEAEIARCAAACRGPK